MELKDKESLCMVVDKETNKVEMSVMTLSFVSKVHEKGMELSELLKKMEVTLSDDEQKQNKLIGEMVEKNVAPMLLTAVFKLSKRVGFNTGMNVGLVTGVAVSVCAYACAQLIMWIW